MIFFAVIHKVNGTKAACDCRVYGGNCKSTVNKGPSKSK